MKCLVLKPYPRKYTPASWLKGLCASLTLLPLTACASERGLKLPVDGMGDRQTLVLCLVLFFQRSPVRKGARGLLQGAAGLMWLLGGFCS